MKTVPSFFKTWLALSTFFFLLSLHLLAADDEELPEGVYHIKNLFLSSQDPDNPLSGLLACAIEKTSHGVYNAEILDGKADEKTYPLKEEHRDSLLWDIRKVQYEGATYYIIRNLAHRGCFLTLCNQNACFYGYWCQVVSGEESEAHKTGQWAKGAVEFLPYGKSITLGTGWLGQTAFGTETLTEGMINATGIVWPFKGSQESHEAAFPFTALWILSRVENGTYTLKNRGEEVKDSALGILSCATTLLPADKKRALILHDFPYALNEAFTKDRDVCGSSRTQVLWELSLQTISEGSYTINHSSGKLSRSATPSGSGYYAEVLKEEGEVNKSLGDSAVWEIQKAPDEGGLYYTIRNCAVSGEGWLTWADKKVSVGYRLQVLADNGQYFYNAFPGSEAQYGPGGGNRKHILWKITQVGNGQFILKNIGAAGLCQPDSGILGWGGDVSSGGQAQLLWDSSKESGDSIIWNLICHSGAKHSLMPCL